MTYTLIQTITVGSGGATQIEFTNIPQNATDLILYVSGRGNQFTFRELDVQFNNNTANYNYIRMSGAGSNSTLPSSDSSNGASSLSVRQIIPGTGTTADTFSNVWIHIPNYTFAANKDCIIDGVSENNAVEAWSSIMGCVFTVTAAITSIKLTVSQATNFVQNSMASLYSVTRA